MASKTGCAFAVVSVAFGVTACSSSGGTVNGTINGMTMVPAAALFTNGPGGSGTSVTLVNVPGFCDSTAKGLLPKNLETFRIAFSPEVKAAGTFALDNISVSAVWAIDDATCNQTSTASATAGAVVVTGLSSANISGTFDLMFGADHVTGSFSASYCAPSFPSGLTCT